MGGSVGKVVSHGVGAQIGHAIGSVVMGPVGAVGGAIYGGKKGISSIVPGLEHKDDYTPTLLAQDDPKMQLARSGGAPLLANIAMGADVETALAGYFGRDINSGDWRKYLETLPPNELAAINGVRDQLKQVQSNTTLRNQAVQKIVDDFPNVTAKAAEARKASGEEFDSTTQQYMDLAMNKLAAKYNASGMSSSGAAVAASARAGAEMGLQKLDYMGQREQVGYGQAANEWNARYTEANALRGFQQTMLGQGVQQGFSADQSMLARKQQTDMQNANFVNQGKIMDNQNQQAMLGAIGGVAGTAIGAAIGGPPGAMAGSYLGRGMAASNSANNTKTSMGYPTGGVA